MSIAVEIPNADYMEAAGSRSEKLRGGKLTRTVGLPSSN